MAQNISLWGASYSDVPSVLLPKQGGGTASFTDVSDTTAAAADVASGKYFYTSAGVRTAGTSSGGGGTGVTLVASESVTVSTTSTTAATVETWSTGHSELWSANIIILIHIFDKAGAREGYFYGSENVLLNNGALSSSNTSTTGFYRQVIRYQSGAYAQNSYTSSTGYGVYADTLYNDGRIRIRRRYNSGTSLTIDGTYQVDVYAINPGTGVLYPPVTP